MPVGKNNCFFFFLIYCLCQNFKWLFALKGGTCTKKDSLTV